jgi:P-type conjugative transfer protein TrbG
MTPLILLTAAMVQVAGEPQHPAAAPNVVASAPVPNPPALRHGRGPHAAASPIVRVAAANEAARMQPSDGAYANAAQVYAFAEGALYQVYASPGEVTDIVLQPGEALLDANAVAAGDTVRWEIGNTSSGAGDARRVHIIVKPTGPALRTNMVINTDRRTYYLELRATAATYMASIGWKYPADPVRPAPPPVLPPPPIEGVNFDYKIGGDRPSWRPLRVFDDGRQTVIEFPAAVAQSQMPPLFVNGPDGKPTSLVNYRVAGQRIVVDRLFEKAELKIGQGRGQQKVDIERSRRP